MKSGAVAVCHLILQADGLCQCEGWAAEYQEIYDPQMNHRALSASIYIFAEFDVSFVRCLIAKHLLTFSLSDQNKMKVFE